MLYRMIRKGNYFRQWMLDELFDDITADNLLEYNMVAYAGNNLYRGEYAGEKANVKNYNNLIDSNILLYMKDTNRTYNIREIRKKDCSIPLALASGYIKYTPNGLEWDGEMSLDYKENTEYKIPDISYSEDILFRKGNVYTIETYNMLRKNLYITNPNIEITPHYIIGKEDSPLSKILIYPNERLLGIPYIYYRELLTGRKHSIEVTENNIENIMPLVMSGVVFIRANKIYLDYNKHKIKTMKEWEAENIKYIK